MKLRTLFFWLVGLFIGIGCHLWWKSYCCEKKGGVLLEGTCFKLERIP